MKDKTANLMMYPTDSIKQVKLSEINSFQKQEKKIIDTQETYFIIKAYQKRQI